MGLLSGGGVGEAGVGLAGGGLAAAVSGGSGARPVDPETDFLGGVFFFFFAMTAVLQAIPVQSGYLGLGEFKLDRNGKQNNNDARFVFEMSTDIYVYKSMRV